MNNTRVKKRISRRLIRGALYVMVGLFAWFAQQKGWLSDQNNVNQQTSQQNQQTSTRVERSESDSFEPIRTNASTQNNSAAIETLRLEDPLERGESHAVTNDMKTVTTRTHKRNNDNQKIAELFKNKRSDTWVTAYGQVGRILPDDNKGSRHQRFLMDIGQQKWLLIAHNIDLAPYVPLKQGDRIIVHGEYEYNDKGGVIHWTHHDPRGYKEGGYIELNNKRYE